ncbi:MAG: hypothetical protein KKD44_11385 [Proteobacteria bacterium]|nr:hypothetical protein [Pseudomonadota bacterium]
MNLGSSMIQGRSVNAILSTVSDYWFPSAQKSSLAVEKYKNQLKYYTDSVVFGDKSMLEKAHENKELALGILTDINQSSQRWNIPDQTCPALIKSIDDFSRKASPIYMAVIMSLDDNSHVDDLMLKKMNDRGLEILKKLEALASFYNTRLNDQLVRVRNMSHRGWWINVFMALIIVSISLP